MAWLVAPPLDSIVRRSDGVDPAAEDRRIARLVRAGDLVRVTRGSYAPAADWAALDPLARHAQFVWEVAARMAPGAVFSHHAAAALHGMDRIGPWPGYADVGGEPSSGSSGVIRRHRRPIAAGEAVSWHRHSVTTPVRTAVDLAATGYLAGVVAADQALWARRPGGPLASAADLFRAAAAYDGRATARVQRVADFARPGADSVRESQSRVLIVAMGFPEPELQHPFLLHGGRAFSDFWWPDHRHAGEFDGTGKYLDPRLLQGRTPRQALLAEKDRGDELRRQVRALSRWRTGALDRPAQLYDILRRDGLPTAKSRPAR
jgi:hypothetical protein